MSDKVIDFASAKERKKERRGVPNIIIVEDDEYWENLLAVEVSIVIGLFKERNNNNRRLYISIWFSLIGFFKFSSTKYR